MRNSFNHVVKTELIKLKCECMLCRRFLVYGMIISNYFFLKNKFLFYSDNIELMKFCRASFNEELNIKLHFINGHGKLKGLRYIYDYNEFNELFSRVESDFENIKKGKDIFKNRCCKSAFLRGIFLVSGRITDPNKGYHLEISLSYDKLKDIFVEILNDAQVLFKSSLRRKKHVLYLKESGAIEDFLTFIGASNMSLEIMNVKVVKSIRNRVNRLINCETSNIDKVVETSCIQLNDIKYIIDKKGLDYLEKDLKDIALIRLDNPEMSLSDIKNFMNSNVSRSTIYRRLKKINKIANDLRNHNV